jgi:hypothetical protein
VRLLLLAGLVSIAVGGSSRATETLTVSNVSPTPIYSSLSLLADHAYRVQVSGTVSDWCTDTSCSAVDPSTAPEPDVGVDALYCYAAWRCPTPQNWQALQVNGVGLDKLTLPSRPIRGYSPAHTYTAYVAGIRGRLSFVAADAAKGSSADNSGDFTVTLQDLGPARVDYAFTCWGAALMCRGAGSALGQRPNGTLQVGGYRLVAGSAAVSEAGGAVSGLLLSGRVLASRGDGCPKGTPMQLTLAANALVLEVFCGPLASHIYTTSDVDARLAYAG